MPSTLRPARPLSALALILALAFLAPALAGCLSSDESEDSGTPEAETPANPDGTIPTDVIVDDGKGSFNESDAGHLPHVHNYWDGREVVLLMDEPREVEILSERTFFTVFMDRQPTLGAEIFELPEGALVYEGTGKMTITPTWTDPTITGLSLSYRHASTREYGEPIALSSGTPLEIAVTPDMTDMPHQLSSRWSFWAAATGAAVGVAQGSVNFKIEITKVRDVMLFPGHPVTYDGVDQYLLADVDAHTKNYNLATMMVAFATNSFTDDSIVPGVVPMGTKAILVNVTVAGTTDTAITNVNGIYLSYRTASGGWGRGMRAELMEQLSQPESNFFVYGIYVDDSIVDGAYDTESMWRFRALPREQSAATGDYCRWICGGAELQYHATITAYNFDPTGGEITKPEDEDRN